MVVEVREVVARIAQGRFICLGVRTEGWPGAGWGDRCSQWDRGLAAAVQRRWDSLRCDGARGRSCTLNFGFWL